MPDLEKKPAVVFDIGNVLITWDPRHLYRTVFEDEAEMEWFLANVCTMAWNLEQDRGRRWADATAELIARHPEWKTHIEAYDERWSDMVPGAIDQNVAVLERLKAMDWPTYGITNFSREKFDVAQTRFPFLTLFDGVVVSADVGLLKPDPAIYELFLARHGLRAEECVFLDDSPANVAAAKNVGMAAVHVTPDIDLAAALREHRVPV